MPRRLLAERLKNTFFLPPLLSIMCWEEDISNTVHQETHPSPEGAPLWELSTIFSFQLEKNQHDQDQTSAFPKMRCLIETGLFKASRGSKPRRHVTVPLSLCDELEVSPQTTRTIVQIVERLLSRASELSELANMAICFHLAESAYSWVAWAALHSTEL